LAFLVTLFLGDLLDDFDFFPDDLDRDLLLLYLDLDFFPDDLDRDLLFSLGLHEPIFLLKTFAEYSQTFKAVYLSRFT